MSHYLTYEQWILDDLATSAPVAGTVAEWIRQLPGLEGKRAFDLDVYRVRKAGRFLWLERSDAGQAGVLHVMSVPLTEPPRIRLNPPVAVTADL